MRVFIILFLFPLISYADTNNNIIAPKTENTVKNPVHSANTSYVGATSDCMGSVSAGVYKAIKAL